jgi:hypothetical protein
LIPLSVESVAGFEALVRQEWKITDKTNLSQIYKILAEKVHPLALGDVFRARQQIELLAKELLLQHRKDLNNIKKIVHTLSKSLGSHDYLIYRTEAKKLMGSQIVHDPDVENLIWDLYTDFAQEMALGIPFDMNILLSKMPAVSLPMPQPVSRSVNAEVKLVLIETTEQGDQAVKRMVITENLIPQPNGIARNIMSQDTFAGWEIYS